MKKKIGVSSKKDKDSLVVSDVSQDSIQQRKLKEELKAIKNELSLMKVNIGQSHEFSKISPRTLKAMRDSDGKSLSRAVNGNSFNANSEDFVNLKRKVMKNEISIDDLESKFKKMENDFQRRMEVMKEGVEAEIDSLKILKERVKTVSWIFFYF